jgi:hypothetical protein
MKSLFKIYRRYILSAGWIAAVVILVNMCVMMMVGTYFASQNRENPDSVGRRRIMEVSSHLNREKGGTPYLEEEGYKLLEDTGAAFAFLLMIRETGSGTGRCRRKFRFILLWERWRPFHAGI